MPAEVSLARPTPPPTSPAKKTGPVQRDERSSLLSFQETLNEEEKKRPVDSALIPVFGPVPAPVVLVDQERAAVPVKTAGNPSAAGVSSTPASGPIIAAGESQAGSMDRSAKDKSSRFALQGSKGTSTQARVRSERVPTQGPLVQGKAGSETSPANSVGGNLLQLSLAGETGLQALPGQNQPLPAAEGPQQEVRTAGDSRSNVQASAAIQAGAVLPSDGQVQPLPVSTTADPANPPVLPTVLQPVSSDPLPNPGTKQVGSMEPLPTAAGKAPIQKLPGQAAMGASQLVQPGSIQVQTEPFVNLAVSNPSQARQSISDGKPVLNTNPAPSQPIQAQTPVNQTKQPESVQAAVPQAADANVPNLLQAEQAGKAGKPVLEANSTPGQPPQTHAAAASSSRPETGQVSLEQTVDPLAPNPSWPEQAAPSGQPGLKTSPDQGQPIQASTPVAKTSQSETFQAPNGQVMDQAVSKTVQPEQDAPAGKLNPETSPTQDKTLQAPTPAANTAPAASVQVSTAQAVDSGVSASSQPEQAAPSGKLILETSPALTQPLQTPGPAFNSSQLEAHQADTSGVADAIVSASPRPEQAAPSGQPGLKTSPDQGQPIQAPSLDAKASQPESFLAPYVQVADANVSKTPQPEQTAPSGKLILETSPALNQPLQTPGPAFNSSQLEAHQADTSQVADAIVSASSRPEQAAVIGKPALDARPAQIPPLQVPTPAAQAVDPTLSAPPQPEQAADVGKPVFDASPATNWTVQSPSPAAEPVQINPSPSTPAQPVKSDRAVDFASSPPAEGSTPPAQPGQSQSAPASAAMKDNMAAQAPQVQPVRPDRGATVAAVPLPVRISNQPSEIAPAPSRVPQNSGNGSEPSVSGARTAGLPSNEALAVQRSSLEAPAADPNQAPAGQALDQSKQALDIKINPPQAPVSAHAGSTPANANNSSGAVQPGILKVSQPSAGQKNGQAEEQDFTEGDAPKQAAKKTASQTVSTSNPFQVPAEIQAGGSKGFVLSAKPDLPVIQQVIDKIQEAVQQGRTSLRMQLNPKDLGAIDVRLVSNGQSVSITMITEKPSTGQLLEKQMDQLRANLVGAGINLANVNIGHQAANGQQGSGFTREPAPERTMEGGKNTADSQLESGSSPYTNRANTDSRIDYRI